MKQIDNSDDFKVKLKEYQELKDDKGNPSHVLVIDGQTLEHALTQENQINFILIAIKSESVICCRCSPKQKAQIAELIKLNCDLVTCAIGDGGNDIGMIQNAHVGIGIVGKEGKQAALAADYSILQFDYLRRLLLYHGRHCYKRTALLSQFVIHRGFIICVMQFIFIISFNFVTMQVFNSLLLMGFSVVFTTLPVFCLVFDKDVDGKTAMGNPQLYKILCQGRELNLKTFLGWIFRSVYCATVLMILSFYIFQDSFLIVSSLCYSSLVLIEFIMTLTELNTINKWSSLSTCISFIFYSVIWFAFPKIFGLKRLTEWEQFGYVILMVTVSYGPILLAKIARKYIFPTDYEKCLQSIKKEQKQHQKQICQQNKDNKKQNDNSIEIENMDTQNSTTKFNNTISYEISVDTQTLQKTIHNIETKEFTTNNADFDSRFGTEDSKNN